LLDIFVDVKVEELARANKITAAEAREHLEKTGAKIAATHIAFAIPLPSTAPRRRATGTPFDSPGHTSVKITEKHYSPWVRERPKQAEADVKRAWAQDSVALLETKGTLPVHGKNKAVC
jgi:hypothetical protein